MPNRIIREGINTSEKVDLLSWQAEVAYRRLINVVDDFGRYDGRPSIIRAACFPLRLEKVREADISRWIAECEKAGLIALYVVDGKSFVQLFNLGEPRAKSSKYPPLSAGARMCAQTRADVPYSYSNAPIENSRQRVRCRSPVFDEKSIEIPVSLRNPLFESAWRDWLQYRRERRKAVTESTAKGQLAELDKWGSAKAIQAIRNSIRQGWTGLFEPEVSNGQQNRPSVDRAIKDD